MHQAGCPHRNSNPEGPGPSRVPLLSLLTVTVKMDQRMGPLLRRQYLFTQSRRSEYFAPVLTITDALRTRYCHCGYVSHVLLYSRFKCDECGSKFTRKETLKAHLVKIHGDQSLGAGHICPDCGKLFGKSSTLTKHINHIHQKKFK